MTGSLSLRTTTARIFAAAVVAALAAAAFTVALASPSGAAPSDTNQFTVQARSLTTSANSENRPLTDLSLEIYASDGSLLVNSGPITTTENDFTQNGIACDTERYTSSIYTYFVMNCSGVPNGAYGVGTSGHDGWSTYVHQCNVYGQLEPIDNNFSRVEVDGYETAECFLRFSPLPTSSLWVGIGTTQPYSYTLDLETPPTLHITNATGTVDLSTEAIGSETMSDSPQFCPTGESDVIGYWAYCLLLPGGEYTVTAETPDGLISGSMYCRSDSDEDYALGSTVALPWDSSGTCVMYLGTGVPIHVDLSFVEGTGSASDLKDITIEAFDEQGNLVATAKDPAPGSCSLQAGSNLPAGVVSGKQVADSSACAVLWVKPPFNVTSGASTATASYTIGVSGANVKSYTLDVTDITWDKDGPIDIFGANQQDPFPFEPLTTAIATLSVNYDTGVFSAGALAHLTLEIAVLAETGPDARAGGLIAVSSALVLMGAGALIVVRRRITAHE